MQLSPTLRAQVHRLCLRYGNGQGEDMAQDCFLILLQRPENEICYALRIAKEVCINWLRKEEVRASAMSTNDPNFVEPTIDGKAVDVESYINHIHSARLRAIVDQYVDGETPLSDADRQYLGRNRSQLDQDLRKYLKTKSPWMLLVEKIEPFRRSLKRLRQDSLSRFRFENA